MSAQAKPISIWLILAALLVGIFLIYTVITGDEYRSPILKVMYWVLGIADLTFVGFAVWHKYK